MAKLSPEQREAIRLTVVEKMSNDDAAAALGIPVGTFNSRLLAAKRVIYRAAEELDESSRGGSR